MPVSRKTISFGQQIAIDRQHDPYVFGGNWDPMNRQTGTDCSGCVVDALDGSINGTAMEWTRHGLSTEDWRPPSMGGNANPLNGPFGTIMVNDPSQFPKDAAVLIAMHHGPGGGANSHTWCQVDQLAVETHGSDNQFSDGATVINSRNSNDFNDAVRDVHDTSYANNWWYLPGPIVEDGTPIPHQPSGSAPAPSGEPHDTLWADVSEFQTTLNDSYWAATYADANTGPWNYEVISIRSNDGDHVDNNFAANYQNAVAALQAGKCRFFIVYYYFRAGGDAVNNHMQLVKAQGGPHPKMVSMIDLESGGNPSSDVSNQVNSDYHTLQQWLGDDRRIIGYANTNDERTMWQMKPAHVPMILAGYGTNPNDPSVFKIAHQYTDGTGFGDGLPEGAAPFGNCDMNSADGLSPSQLASALGVGDVKPAVQTPVGTNLTAIEFLATHKPALDTLVARATRSASAKKAASARKATPRKTVPQKTGDAGKKPAATTGKKTIPPAKKATPRKTVPQRTGDGGKKPAGTTGKKTPSGRARATSTK